MADPDVRHSESTTDTSDNDDRAQNSENVTMEFAHQNEPCSTTNESPNAPAFPQDFSVFIQEHEESQLDAMFSSRFTVEDELYAEVCKGFPEQVVLFPWTSRPKRTFDYTRRRDPGGSAYERGEQPPNKRWAGEDVRWNQHRRNDQGDWRGGDRSGWGRRQPGEGYGNWHGRGRGNWSRGYGARQDSSSRGRPGWNSGGGDPPNWNNARNEQWTTNDPERQSNYPNR